MDRSSGLGTLYPSLAWKGEDVGGICTWPVRVREEMRTLIREPWSRWFRRNWYSPVGDKYGSLECLQPKNWDAQQTLCTGGSPLVHQWSKPISSDDLASCWLCQRKKAYCQRHLFYRRRPGGYSTLAEYLPSSNYLTAWIIRYGIQSDRRLVHTNVRVLAI